MQHRAHPALCWLSAHWHHPVAAVVWGSRVGHSPGKGLGPSAPKSGRTLRADMPSLAGCMLGLLLVAFWGECPSRLPQWLLAHGPRFLPARECPPWQNLSRRYKPGGQRKREKVFGETQRHFWVKTLQHLGCDFSSYSAVNYTLRKCHIGVVGFEQENLGGKTACKRTVQNQGAVALAWGSDFIHSTRHEDRWQI